MTSIAVCMIVKNEEEVLARCLESIAGLWDELIIVDTGSTDRTVEIAEAYGARVLHYKWVAPGHKGDARNFGISKAVSQWIVVIDADEVLNNATEARKIIDGSQPAAAIMVQFHNFIDGQVTLSWRQIRIFKRGTHNYKYREHEVPAPIDPDCTVRMADIVFEHRSPDGRQSGKSAPMLARLALDVEENSNDPHPLYFYHRECLIQGDNKTAIDLGLKYLELTRGGGFIQADIYGNMASAYQNLGNELEATKYMHLAANCEPNKREWLYRLAVLYTYQNLWNVALGYLRAACELLPNEDRQWEPQTTARIYDLMNICQQNIAHNIAHNLAHSHTH